MKSIDKINHHLANIGAPVLNFVAFNGFLSRIFVSTVRLLFVGHRHGQPDRMCHVFADIRSGGIDALPVVILMAPTVIDPSAERQPHSAFLTRNRRKAN